MTLGTNFWESYQISVNDLEDIYNYLLETESPLDKFEITKFLIRQKIAEKERALLVENSNKGAHYLPEKTYSTGDKLIFPAKGQMSGEVKSTRSGLNPAYPDLQVIEVEVSTGEHLFFAANLQEHILNNPTPTEKNILLDADYVFTEYGQSWLKNYLNLLKIIRI